MLHVMKKIGFMMLLMVFLLTGCNDQPAQQLTGETEPATDYLDKPLPLNERKRVLVLHSYHPEYVWVQEVNKGILSGLAEERYFPKKNIIVEYFHMDTKRKTSKVWKLQVAEQAMEKILSWKPHVVIATDDNAQKYVVAKMKDSGVNFVFLGVNADPMKYRYIDSLENPGGTITGSIERARFEETVKLLRRLKPGVKKIAIICDDGPTGVPIVKRVLALAPQIGVEVVDVRRIGNFSRWKQYVMDVQDKADALLVVVYHTLKDNKGNAVHENEVLDWTIQNSKLPDIGFWSWAVDGGLLCSEAISGYQQGHYAASVASYVLMGQLPGDFSIDKPQRGELCVNMARAEMLGIEVPADIKRIATVFNAIGSNLNSAQ